MVEQGEKQEKAFQKPSGKESQKRRKHSQMSNVAYRPGVLKAKNGKSDNLALVTK